ncbi:MAG: DUF2953 domain-containing protein [Clostridiales bacterium]
MWLYVLLAILLIFLFYPLKFCLKIKKEPQKMALKINVAWLPLGKKIGWHISLFSFASDEAFTTGLLEKLADPDGILSGNLGDKLDSKLDKDNKKDFAEDQEDSKQVKKKIKEDEKEENGKNSKLKLLKWLKLLLKSLSVENISLKMSIGLEDAAQTAICTGMVQIIWGLFLSLLSALCKKCSDVKALAITPVFGKNEVLVDFACIVSYSCGDIISRSLWMLVKSRWA